jgi:hypothetical protein
MVEYTTTGPTAPTTDGTDEAPTEDSPLRAGAGDAEVDDDIDDENMDADHDDGIPLCFRSMSDILVMPRFAPRALVAEEVYVVSSDEPTSFIEAERSPSWRKAMMEEMGSIEKNGTWSLVDLSPGRKPIRGEVGVQGEAGRARGDVQAQGTPCGEGLRATTWHRLR